MLQLKDTVQAMQVLDVITGAVPYFTEGYCLKFRLHMARNEWKPVAEGITRALRNSRADAPRSKHSYLLTLQALAYSKNRHDDDAVKTLNEAIKVDEKNDFAYLERGRLWLSLGKASKAKGDLREASVLGNQQAKQMLAEMLDDK